MNKITKIVEKIKTNSQRSIESEEVLREYITQSLTEGRPVTFFNWECPPRFLDKTKNGQIFINYDVDLAKIARGEKLDEFTEIPRVVEKSEDEKRILTFLKSLKFKVRFAKIIADTNAWYLTPQSLDILGERRIVKMFREFKNLVEEKTKEYPVKTKVYLFRELLKSQGFEDDYNKAFASAYQALRETPTGSVSENTLEKQFARTREHAGITNPEMIKDFSLRTIATYGAEGIVFDKLSRTEKFSNCVWLNIEEVSRRTIEITNFLRRRRGMPNLPMVFPV